MTGINIPGIDSRDFNTIFEAMDTNNNHSISVNELALYIKGA
jgi:hypothetical protein